MSCSLRVFLGLVLFLHSSHSASPFIRRNTQICNDTETLLQGEVLVEIQGEEADIATQVPVLETTFVDTYNGFVQCTNNISSSRFLHDATFDSMDFGGSNTTSFGMTDSTVFYKFRVRGTCLGECPSHPALFQDNRNTVSSPSCPTCSAPYMGNFTQAWNDTHPFLSIQRVVVLQSIFEGCATDNATVFESNIFVDFVGNFQEASSSEQETLRRGLVSTYNSLNVLSPDTCDPFFRQVLSMEIVNTDVRRNPAREASNSPHEGPLYVPSFLGGDSTVCLGCKEGTRPFVYHFKVLARCHGCNGVLFDGGSLDSRRRLHPSRHDNHRSLSSDECECPMGVSTFQAPSRFAFAEALNKTLKGFRSEGLVSFVRETIAVAEMKPIHCAGVSTPFVTNVLVNGTLSSTDVDTEKILLELGFGASYNDLTEADYCDPLFRTVKDTTIVNVWGETALHVLIRGVCQGCERNNTSLFGAVAMTDDSLPADGTCYCDIYSTANNRAPYATEFAMAYNSTVPQLNVMEVVEDVSLDGSFPSTENPTTTSPTDSPSLLPIMIPTTLPTTIMSTLLPSSAPSGSPILSPTTAPTFHPTVDSSARPILAPTVAPTVVPTLFPNQIVSSATPSETIQDPFEGIDDVNRWENENNGLYLEILNALEPRWHGIFNRSVQEWNDGNPNALNLETILVDPDSECTPYARFLKVCNGNYSNTGWAGLNTMFIATNGFIFASIARLNEYYLETASEAGRQYTMCHEMGHGFGLPHTDENFYNPNLGNCMDLTANPETNQGPDESNFQLLAAVYGVAAENNTRRVLGEEPTTRKVALPDSVMQSYKNAMKELPSVAHGRSKTNTCWKLLHRSSRSARYSLDLGDGYSAEMDLLLADT